MRQAPWPSNTSLLFLPSEWAGDLGVMHHDAQSTPDGEGGDFTGTISFLPYSGKEGDTSFDDPGYWNQMHRRIAREWC